MIHQIECPLKWNQWSYSRATSIGWGGRANGSKGQLYPSPKEVRSIALIWKVQKTQSRLRASIHEWLPLKHSCTLLKWSPKQKNTDPTMLSFLESRILGLFWMFKTLILRNGDQQLGKYSGERSFVFVLKCPSKPELTMYIWTSSNVTHFSFWIIVISYPCALQFILFEMWSGYINVKTFSTLKLSHHWLFLRSWRYPFLKLSYRRPEKKAAHKSTLSAVTWTCLSRYLWSWKMCTKHKCSEQEESSLMFSAAFLCLWSSEAVGAWWAFGVKLSISVGKADVFSPRWSEQRNR